MHDDDDDPQPLIRGELPPYLERFAAKFNRDADPRIKGGKGMELISCPDCEDEGFVYFHHLIDGSPYWMVARCVCAASDTLPKHPRSCDGMRLEENPTWAELGLSRDLVWPLRLQPFAAATGLIPFPPPEPMKGKIKYRRPLYRLQRDERAANQVKYDRKWGSPNPHRADPPPPRKKKPKQGEMYSFDSAMGDNR